MDFGFLVALLIVLTVALPLIGVLQIGNGAALIRNPQGRFPLGKRRYTERLHDRVPMLRYAAPEEQIAIFNQMMRLNGWATVGLGIGWVLGTALLGAGSIFISVTRDPLSGLFTYLSLEASALTLPTALGVALGFRAYGRAVQRAGLVPGAMPWQARRPSDYRAAWIAWLLTALVVGGVALAGAGALLVRGNLEVAPLPFPPFITAQARLVTLLLAIPTLCGPLVMWLAARWIASAPPVIVSSYSGLANDVEDLARASLTSVTTLLVWRSSGWLLGGMGLTFLLYCLFVIPAPSLSWLVVIAALLIVGFVMMIVGLLARLLARGRLGGRRVGWPWRPRLMGVPAPVQSWERLP